MPLYVENNGKKDRLHVETFGEGFERVRIGEYTISMEEFFAITEYALTNTDLSGGADPRLRFVENTKKLSRLPGRRSGKTRLGYF